VADREVAMEREEAELRALQQEEASLRAANKRITTMAEELRKAELVRDRLEGLARLMGSYPEGHDMRTRLEVLDVQRALEGVNEDIRIMTDALLYPGGT
jgi:Cys-tRNA synthase (O-phospho-L-seryl-tRNA:Cys-tRNA synthase)